MGIALLVKHFANNIGNEMIFFKEGFQKKYLLKKCIIGPADDTCSKLTIKTLEQGVKYV